MASNADVARLLLEVARENRSRREHDRSLTVRKLQYTCDGRFGLLDDPAAPDYLGCSTILRAGGSMQVARSSPRLNRSAIGMAISQIPRALGQCMWTEGCRRWIANQSSY